MMDTEEQLTISSLPTKDKWVIFNVQETGYYRVNYDAENWNLIIQQLKENHESIQVINRAQIIDDVLNLARAGKTDWVSLLYVYVLLTLLHLLSFTNQGVLCFHELYLNALFCMLPCLRLARLVISTAIQ